MYSGRASFLLYTRIHAFLSAEQTTQWPNEKGQTTIYKALHIKLKIE
jgi:hypothetical protein